MKKIMLIFLLLGLQFNIFAETLYPVKILFINDISNGRYTQTVSQLYKDDVLIVKKIGYKTFSKPNYLYLFCYNVENNSVHSIGGISGENLYMYITEEESIAVTDIYDNQNGIKKYFLYNEDSFEFTPVDSRPVDYLTKREIPDIVSQIKTPLIFWEKIGDYYVKEFPLNDELLSFVIIDSEGSFINRLPVCMFDDGEDVLEHIRTSQNGEFLYLNARLSTQNTHIDERLIGNNKRYITIIYKIVPDKQVSLLNSEIVDITEITSEQMTSINSSSTISDLFFDTPDDILTYWLNNNEKFTLVDMPAYKVTTRTVDASSLIVPLKPDARILKAADNLRLRKSELTSSDIVTTMLKGTPVKIIATGRQETIDGITGNWVQVEVQSGGKDRNGNPIPEGTTGWCFGGYLE